MDSEPSSFEMPEGVIGVSPSTCVADTTARSFLAVSMFSRSPSWKRFWVGRTGFRGRWWDGRGVCNESRKSCVVRFPTDSHQLEVTP